MGRNSYGRYGSSSSSREKDENLTFEVVKTNHQEGGGFSKRGKEDDQDDMLLGDEAGDANKRVRKKRRVGRKCKGMCYALPPLPQTLLQQDAKKRREGRNKKIRDKNKIKKKQRREQEQAAAEANKGEGEGEGGPPTSSSKDKQKKNKKTRQDKRRRGHHDCLSEEALAQMHVYLKACGHETPTAIQDQCWPLCLQGYDVQARAEPGTGKTFGYMFPLLYQLQLLSNKNKNKNKNKDQDQDQDQGQEKGSIALTTPATEKEKKEMKEKKGELQEEDEEEEGKAGPPETPQKARALVLVPTRELAKQILVTCRALRHLTQQRGLALTGGIVKEEQVELLKTNSDVVIATPGRLCDLIENHLIDLSRVEVFVIDEADKMLQKGLEDQLQKIQDQLVRAKKEVNMQTLLFSATFPDSLMAKCKTWLEKENKVIDLSSSSNTTTTKNTTTTNNDNDNDTIKSAKDKNNKNKMILGKEGESESESGAEKAKLLPTVSQNIKQIVHVCAEHKKGRKLLKYLDAVREEARENSVRHVPKILVFVNTIKKARYLFGFLRKNDHRILMIHGKRNQKERNGAIQDFKSGKVNTLVATDIAGRGIHIPGLKHVVLYDFPPSIEQYVHRIGRTGRQQEEGESYAFFTRNLAPLAPSLIELLREHKQEVDPHLQVVADAAVKALAEKKEKEKEEEEEEEEEEETKTNKVK